MTQELTSIDDTVQLLSCEGPYWVHKHSATCPVATMIQRVVEGYADDHPDHPVHRVTVQTARDVSNHLAEVLGVRHQSPQVLLIHGGRAVWDASHFQVTAEKMEKAWGEASS